MYEDKTLVCKECGNEFTFTAGEQEFYAEKGFVNEPQRCKACRDARKNSVKAEREMFEATCASCGGTAKVPFRPREDRPVYCSDCFAKMNRLSSGPFSRPQRHDPDGGRYPRAGCRGQREYNARQYPAGA